MENSKNKEMLIPLALCTGSFNDMEAMLLVSYSGDSVIHQKNKQYMSLEAAIEWNRIEASQSTGVEKEYRELLLKELENALESGEFQYTNEIVKKWAVVFPSHAKSLLKSQSKKLSPELKEIVKSAVKT